MTLYLWCFTFRATNRIRDEPSFSAVIVALFVFAGLHTLFGYLLSDGQGVGGVRDDTFADFSCISLWGSALF